MSHLINIYDIVPQVVPLYLAYQAPTYKTDGDKSSKLAGPARFTRSSSLKDSAGMLPSAAAAPQNKKHNVNQPTGTGRTWAKRTK